ncbi:exodeoxyribonuclease V subunit beta [Aliidiomarina halalkaliphila]|uniref:RecBCD enzyme subunit RecB n=1 Tax=Aliidiomarina halalkaliphila TaxID=2593535 RepID=A0A552X045_9GAMM|nr:exodeoxyribonuclease V subunit beta [Aliidiomarina halalkaliphila]TRW48438.1 exodeoxyribonuclease V subunit beta [Aliidiomarina halalkaliphila]
MSAINLQPLEFPLQGVQLIEASAGTGKTYTLAALYVRLVLAHGRNAVQEPPHGRALLPPQILVVTFTTAATEELRDRIRARLVEAAAVFRGQPSNDAFLQELLNEYDSNDYGRCAAQLQLAAEWMDDAAIFTIHGWCQRMLSEHAFDSGLGFQQEMAHDLDDMMLGVARDYWRTWLYELSDARVLDDLGPLAQSPEQLLGECRPWLRPERGAMQFHAAGQALPKAHSPKEASGALQSWYQKLDQRIAQLKPLLTADTLAFLDDLYEQGHLKKNIFQPKTWFSKERPLLQQWLSNPNWINVLSSEGEAWVTKFARRKVEASLKKGSELPEHPLFDALDQLQDFLATRPEIRLGVLSHAAEWLAEGIETQKQRTATMGFDDLLTRLHSALTRPGGEVLAERIRSQFPVAMVDEFQDTDPIQFAIFQHIYPDVSATDYNLTLVGDPKQAIYSFRGADLNTYLQARRWTQGRHYNLPRNFRSTQDLVAAVNALFVHGENLERGAFGFKNVSDNELPYFPVSAHGQTWAYEEDGTAMPPVSYWLASELPGEYRKAAYQRDMAAACANRIAAMLNGSAAGIHGLRGEEGLQPLQPNSFAVLVRSKGEARVMQDALAQHQIRSVFLSDRESVFASEEAQLLLAWMQAVYAPEDEQKLRAALMLRLSMQSDAQLAEWLDDEQSWEQVTDHIRDFQRIWRWQGILPMVQAWLHRFALPSRWLSLNNGERVLTNILHLAELLQRESAQRDGETGLMRWFAAHMQQPSSAEEQIQRLESDASRVQIVTIHKSKGLQYDFVFLPFICAARDVKNKGAIRYSDNFQIILDVMPSEDTVARADWERLQEDVRLLYVALTRPVYGCWLGLASFSEGRGSKSSIGKSALGYLLQLTSETQPSDFQQALESLPWAREKLPEDAYVHIPEHTEARVPALTLARSVAPERWWIASYSALKTDTQASAQGAPDTARQEQHQDDEGELDGADAESKALSAPAVALGDSSTTDMGLHDFPRGASMGTFLHGLLEWACEQGFAESALLSQEQAHLLERRLQQRGLAEHTAAIKKWLKDMLTTPLALPEHEQSMSLATLSSSVSELEFWLEAQHISVADLDRLVQRYFWPEEARANLLPETLNGMLKGFIDLTFVAADGRYWVCDYKSNWLGDSTAAYTDASMRKAMLGKRYDVQAALYLFALHRLLKARIPNYMANPQQHLGGAMYWFIREPEQGQLWMPAAHQFLEEMDALFAASAEVAL